MSTPNPYAAPKAQVADAAAALPESFHPGGRRVPANRGSRWFVHGWQLFKQQPFTWLGLVASFAVINIVGGLVPYIGGVLTVLFTPVFIAGIFIGARAQDAGASLEVSHLFAGFKIPFGNLILVGVLSLVVLLAMGFLAYAILSMFGGGPAMAPEDDNLATFMQALPQILLALLVMSVVILPLVCVMLMATWFAPALIAFHALGPVQALVQSFEACLKNFLPFLVYSFWFVVLAIAASIPLFLGWLVLLPVTLATVYAAYRDIYVSEQSFN